MTTIVATTTLILAFRGRRGVVALDKNNVSRNTIKMGLVARTLVVLCFWVLNTSITWGFNPPRTIADIIMTCLLTLSIMCPLIDSVLRCYEPHTIVPLFVLYVVNIICITTRHRIAYCVLFLCSGSLALFLPLSRAAKWNLMTALLALAYAAVPMMVREGPDWQVHLNQVTARVSQVTGRKSTPSSSS